LCIWAILVPAEVGFGVEYISPVLVKRNKVGLFKKKTFLSGFENEVFNFPGVKLEEFLLTLIWTTVFGANRLRSIYSLVIARIWRVWSNLEAT
jgi:hypothetical protein